MITKIEPTHFDDPELVFFVECQFCSSEYSDNVSTLSDDSIAMQIQKILEEEGWVERESEKYQIQGLCCPNCKDIPDEDL